MAKTARKAGGKAPASSRDRLLHAALSVFASKGFAQATTREIALQAGVFQPQIAYFFSNKEELWKEAVDSAFMRCDAVLDEMLQQPAASPQHRVEMLVRSYLGFAAANPEWASLVLQEGLYEGARSDWLVERWLQSRANKLVMALTGTMLSDAPVETRYRGMSILAILTGAIAVFATSAHPNRIAAVDVGSAEFLEQHIATVTLAIKAVTSTG